MIPDKTFLACVVGFALGAALGYRSTVDITQTHFHEVEYTIDATEVADEW